MADETPVMDSGNVGLMSQANSASMMPGDAIDPVAGHGLETQHMDVGGDLQAPAAGVPTQGGLNNLQPGAPPPMHTRIADGILSAFSKSDGSAGGFLRSVLAGGLAGASAAASGPRQPGGGVARGLALGGNAGYQAVQNEQAQARDQKQQNFENQQKKQAMDLAKQKADQEKTSGDREYDLRLREDARQQAASIRDASMFEKRGTLIDQEIAQGKYTSTKQQAEDLVKQSDDWSALQAQGGARLKVNGAESPEFDHLGDAEDFAMKNQDAVIHGQFKTRLMRNPDSGKWAIMEVPYEAPKWHDVTDAEGKQQRIFTDTQGALAAQKEIAETKHYMNVAAKSSADLKKDLETYKEEGTVKGARKELDKVGGDYSQLSPGSKSALEKDATEQFTKVNTFLERIESKDEELRTPEEKEDLERYKGVRDYYAKQIADLTRPTWVPKPGSPEAKAADEKKNAPAANKDNPAAAAPAPPRPANVPEGYIYTPKGPNGQPGWMKPKPAAPAPDQGVAPAL
jgi:hypothetical protein